MRELIEQGHAYRWQVEAAETRARRAEEASAELRQRVADAIGLTVARPYNENKIYAVTIPVSFSAYALKELGKRMDYQLIAQIVGDSTAKATLDLLHQPGLALPLVKDMRRVFDEDGA